MLNMHPEGHVGQSQVYSYVLGPVDAEYVARNHIGPLEVSLYVLGPVDAEYAAIRPYIGPLGVF